jgi:hypothetical protein
MLENNTQEQESATPTIVANPFSASSWDEQPNEANMPEIPVIEKAIVPVATTPATEDSEVIMDPNEWLKEQLGVDNVDDAKQAFAELAQLREAAKTPAEIKFANEQSQRLFEAIKEGKEDEIYNHLHKKRELSQVDQLKGDQAIRLNLKYSNPHFKDADIQDVFEELYSKPEKPQQELEEEEGDYNVRVQRWEQQVAKIDRKIERDAFTAKQELAKHTNEIVFPDIPKREPAASTAQIDPAILEQQTAFKANVHQKLGTELNNFNGFNVTYKDEAVEIPIAFNVSPEEKQSLIQFVKDEVLGENFNVNDFFNKRWFDEQGNPKQELLNDAYFFNNREKVLQKMVNESATKRILEYKKEISNIKINPTPQGTFNPQTAATEFDNLAKQVWGKS